VGELARCVAFIRAFDERLATRRERTSFGSALFNDELPRVHGRNMLAVELGARPTVDELVGEAERLQAGLAHRKICVDDPYGAELEAGFRQRGWRIARLVVMTHHGAAPAADVPHTAETSADTLAPLWAQGIRSGPVGRDEETVRQLVSAQLQRRAAVAVRYFASLDEGEIAAYCELFSDGRTAQIESVMTLPRFRRQGHGRAVIERALGEAHRSGHDLVFLLADDEDWPKHLYAKLGFEPAGRVWDFVREPQASDS
jgi:GNAT superfamily N-acetyltransferase